MSWHKVVFISGVLLICSNIVFASGLPNTLGSWNNPPGYLLTVMWNFGIWPFCVGLTMCLFAVVLAIIWRSKDVRTDGL